MTGAKSSVVVVVDDEVLVRNLLANLLAKAGFSVLSAADGKEALELIRGYPEPISLVITDVIMPGMSGLELCEQIIKELPHIRVLIISGNTGGQVQDGSRRLPFLHKPFAADRFKQKVREVLDGPPQSRCQAE
jgi:CheY-like chemotaxis protein